VALARLSSSTPQPRASVCSIGDRWPRDMGRTAHSAYAFGATGRERSSEGIRSGWRCGNPSGSDETAPAGEEGRFDAGGALELGQDGANASGIWIASFVTHPTSSVAGVTVTSISPRLLASGRARSTSPPRPAPGSATGSARICTPTSWDRSRACQRGSTFCRRMPPRVRAITSVQRFFRTGSSRRRLVQHASLDPSSLPSATMDPQ